MKITFSSTLLDIPLKQKTECEAALLLAMQDNCHIQQKASWQYYMEEQSKVDLQKYYMNKDKIFRLPSERG